MQIRFSARSFSDLGLYGYLDLTLSIQRAWQSDRRNGWGPTWRHITLGLRSPLLYCRQRGLFLERLRFGWGSGNLYLGVVYIVTTFGHKNTQLQYTRFGPFVWAHPIPWRPYRSSATTKALKSR